MTERRYNDSEVEAIFRAATSGRAIETAHPRAGFTLAELQDVGLKAGLSADVVARAASSLGLRGTTTIKRSIGLPAGVSHTVELGRTLSDTEWDHLVSRMRDELDSHGITGVDGSARSWRGANVRVLLEPSETGQRLRFRTHNEAALALIATGGMLMAIVLVGTMATLFKGSLGAAAGGLIPLSLISAGMMITGALRIPKWARLRASQMEKLGSEAATGR